MNETGKVSLEEMKEWVSGLTSISNNIDLCDMYVSVNNPENDPNLLNSITTSINNYDVDSDISNSVNSMPTGTSLQGHSNYNSVTTGSGTWYPTITTPGSGSFQWIHNPNSSGSSGEDRSVSKEDMEDLLSEIEDKSKECDNKIDEIFEQMKMDRTKTAVLNPVFQYYVGMKEGLDILIGKIKKYLEPKIDEVI